MNSMLSGLLVAAAITLIPACSSSPGADAQFVGKLTSQGIPGDRGVEIEAAHQVCDAIRPIVEAREKHLPMQDMMPVIMESGRETKAVHDRLTAQGLSDDQYGHLIAAAAETYCPDLKESINRMDNTK